MKTIVQLEGEIYTCRTRAERVEKLRDFRDATLRAAANRATEKFPVHAEDLWNAILTVEAPIEPGTLVQWDGSLTNLEHVAPYATDGWGPKEHDTVRVVPIAGHPTARAVVKDGVLHHYDESGRELRLVPKE